MGTPVHILLCTSSLGLFFMAWARPPCSKSFVSNFVTRVLGQSGCLSWADPTIVTDLTDALGAEWEQTPASRFQIGEDQRGEMSTSFQDDPPPTSTGHYSKQYCVIFVAGLSTNILNFNCKKKNLHICEN